MSESVDLRKILENWPYDPENDTRLARGEDGREFLQVRTPMGLEQFELDGRPDGARPHGMDSALEYYTQKLAQARAAGKEADFDLGPRECSELFNEGTLYYFRYVRLFQVKDWIRTIRDTARNLQVFDLVHRYGRRDEDRQFLEKWRPYILRVNASAAIMLELQKNAYDSALRLAKEAIDKVQALQEQDDETFQFERDRSITALGELASQIEKNRPLSELQRLEHQLQRAIERQEFERAAQLRDRIRSLRQQQTC
ncbi:MAG TPA: UvrB/UvrC motif-containing protein [Verrucomicrobiae bacterium]|nr:UvrB/UvrC motif-containing protein [Verrucomicrobiae bacterium]